jgi:cytochrome c biogenesis protein CcdA
MIKFILLGSGISLIILGLGYVIYFIGKHLGNNQPVSSANKKGLLTAIGAIVLGAFIVYKNTKKN